MTFEMIVDRVNEDVAVLLVEIQGKEQAVQLPVQLLPQETKEGDVVNFSLAIDKNRTQEKKEQAADFLRKLLKNGDK